MFNPARRNQFVVSIASCGGNLDLLKGPQVPANNNHLALALCRGRRLTVKLAVT